MNSDRLRMMREKIEIGLVGYSKYLKVKKRYMNYPICFVEGKDDHHYYYPRVKTHCDYISPQFIQCKGKDGVINAIEKIDQLTNENKILAFVDRDFDDPIDDKNVYETPCHSIENLYVNKESFKEICKYVLRLNEQENERLLDDCINLYEERQTEFFDVISELNGWIAYHVKEGNKLKLNSKKLFKDFVEVDLHYIKKIYTFEQLAEIFNIDISDMELERFTEITRKLSVDPMSNFRGKYNLGFLREF